MTRRFATLLCSLLFIKMAAFGQEKVSISASITPLYIHTTFENHALFPDSDGQVVEPVFLDGNKGAFGYSAGAMVYYTFDPGWSIATGILYRYQALRTERFSLAGEGSTSVRHRAIRLPILFNYRSSEKTLSPFYSFGPLIDIPFNARVVATRAGESTQRLRLDSEAGPVFNFLLGAGAIYQFTPGIALTGQPTATYRIGRFGGARTNFQTFELGLQTQFIYTF